MKRYILVPIVCFGPQRHFLELHRVKYKVNLFEMHPGHPNHPVHNKMKQRENIADQCIAAVTPSNVQ